MTLRKENDDQNMNMTPLSIEENMVNEAEDIPTTITSRIQRQDKKVYAVSIRWEHEMEEAAEREKRKKTNREQCCCCLHEHRLGNMHVLWESRDGTPILMVGPRVCFCLSVTSPLILGLSALVCYFIIYRGKVATWFAYCYIPMVFATLVSLSCVSCRNPGLLERVTEQENISEGWYWNEQVGSFRPSGALYCKQCKVLVQDYDHFCPWTGTSIGRDNMSGFKSFVINVNILCLTSIGLVFYQLFY